VPGKNIAIDKPTVGFKGKLIFKTHNPPPKKCMKWGIRLFVIADSDNGYVHSIFHITENLQVTHVTCHTQKNLSLQE
jgi:hypothetical protein